MNWIKWSIIFIFGAIGLMLGLVLLILMPSNQLTVLKWSQPSLIAYGLELKTLPRRLDLFSGAEWDDLRLRYKTSTQDFTVHLSQLKLRHQINFFPPKLIIESLSVESGKVEGSIQASQVANKEKAKESGQVSVPMAIELRELNLQDLSLKIQRGSSVLSLDGLKTRLDLVLDEAGWKSNVQLESSKIEWDSGEATSRGSLAVDAFVQGTGDKLALRSKKLKLGGDSIELAGHHLEKATINVQGLLEMTCITCEKLKLSEESDLVAKMALERLTGPTAQFASLGLDLKVGFPWVANYELLIGNLRAPEVLTESTQLKLSGVGKTTGKTLSLASQASINEAPSAEISIQAVTPEEVTADLKLNLSSKTLQLVKATKGLQSFTKALDLELKAKVELPHAKKSWLAPDGLDGLKSFKSTVTGKARLDPVDGSLQLAPEADFSSEGTVRDYKLAELSWKVSQPLIAMGGMRVSGYTLGGYTNSDFSKILGEFTGQLMMPHSLGKKTPFVLRAEMRDIFMARSTLSTNLVVAAKELADVAIELDDSSGTLGVTGKAALSIDRRVKIFTGLGMSNWLGQRKLEGSFQMVLNHGQNTWLQTQDWLAVPLKLNSKLQLMNSDTTDTSVEKQPLLAQLSVLKKPESIEMELDSSGSFAAGKFARIEGYKLQLASRLLGRLEDYSSLAANTEVDFSADKIRVFKFNMWDLQSKLRASKDRNQIRISQLSFKSNGENLLVNLDGQLENLTGQLDAQVMVRTPSQVSLTEQQKIEGQLTLPVSIAITDGKNFDISGLLKFDKFSYLSPQMKFLQMNGALSFSESVRRVGNQFEFLKLSVRNPFHRVDYTSLQPLLLGHKRLKIDQIEFMDKSFGPFIGIAQLEQNQLSLHQFNLQMGRGRMDGEMHFDILPRQFSMSVLARLQEIRMSEVVPTSWLKGRKANADPIYGRLGLLTDFRRSTMEGRIDWNQVTTGQILTALDVLDPEHENAQFSTLRGFLFSGTTPKRMSMNLHQGLLDVYVDMPLVPVSEIRSIPVSGLIRSSFAFLSKGLSEVPLK